MLNTLRVAILECDTPLDVVAKRRGSYGDIFKQLLNNSTENLRASGQHVKLQVTKWDVVTAQVYPDLSEVDCIWMTGSRHTAFGDDPWILKLVEYVRMVVEQSSIPLIGICFGHQIIGRAFGAPLGPNDKGWEIAVDRITLTPEGKKIFQAESLALHEMHRDIVLEPPKGFVNLGYSNRCAIQGLCKPGQVLSIQAHPEFDNFIMQHLLDTRHKQGIFDDQIFNDGQARASLQHDGVLVASGILRFILASIKRAGSHQQLISHQL